MYLNSLNGSIDGITYPRTVSLNCRKTKPETALEKQLKDANCVKDIPLLQNKYKLSDI